MRTRDAQRMVDRITGHKRYEVFRSGAHFGIRTTCAVSHKKLTDGNEQDWRDAVQRLDDWVKR